MLDSNAILGMMIVSFLIGLITTAISQNIARVVSIITTLPLVIFLIGSLVSGTKIDSVTEIGDGESKTDTVFLVEDSDWSEAAFKVTGSGIIVDYNFVAKLKDGSTTKDTQVGSDNAHLINTTVAIDYSDDRYNSTTDGDWKYETQFSVTNIGP